MNLFVFDIETIPDVEGGRKLLNLQQFSDDDVANAMFNQRRQEVNHDFLPHYLHKIVAISAVLKTPQKCIVWSLGEETSTESELITRFFEGIQRYKPTLISWNGSGFDLPVLHYRALMHKVSAPQYWELGNSDNSFKWNNYISRYHYRHTDIMDVLSGYQAKASAPLDKIALLLNLPGKMGMHGSKVWEAYQQGDIAAIRNYCETDVLNTYLVYLRFDLFRGHLSLEEYDKRCEEVKNMLHHTNKPHLHEFLVMWTKNEL